VFDTDGVTVRGNTVDRSGESNQGRRGINLDGNSDVDVTNNTVALGASGQTGSPNFPVFFAARWCIQVSMSNAPASNYRITNNDLTGAYDGVAGLSQRDVTGLDVRGNRMETVQGVRLNAGGTPPVGSSLTYSDVNVNGNRFDASRFQDGTTTGVRLQNDHRGAAAVTYSDVNVAGNRARDVDEVVVVEDAGIDLQDVRVNGNRLD
jgi:hypothetical protein